MYFVVKSQDPSSYAINEFDIGPVQGLTFMTRGVSSYGNDMQSDMNLVVAHYYKNYATPREFVIYNYPHGGADPTHNNPNNNNILWFSDIIISPYCMVYAKKTSDLIPLCHNIPIEKVEIEFSNNGIDELYIKSIAKTSYKTGIEMEALTAVSVAALTVYDMYKAIDRKMTVKEIRLIEKTGGKSDFFND